MLPLLYKQPDLVFEACQWTHRHLDYARVTPPEGSALALPRLGAEVHALRKIRFIVSGNRFGGSHQEV
jgi:hypothetical protein